MYSKSLKSVICEFGFQRPLCVWNPNCFWVSEIHLVRISDTDCIYLCWEKMCTVTLKYLQYSPDQERLFWLWQLWTSAVGALADQHTTLGWGRACHLGGWGGNTSCPDLSTSDDLKNSAWKINLWCNESSPCKLSKNELRINELGQILEFFRAWTIVLFQSTVERQNRDKRVFWFQTLTKLGRFG